jgi:Tfp pilus assembly protein PilF
MNKKLNPERKLIAIVILLTVVVMLAVGCGGNGAESEAPMDPLSLGERYLLEMNYEQALIHFLAFIEIEPMNPRGYSGAAQAHIGLVQPDEAVTMLIRVLEIFSDDADMLEELQTLL